MSAVLFHGAGSPLTQAGIDAACRTVGVAVPELWAVISVETSGCGFLNDRRPKILFERHVFGRLTNHQFDADDPDVSAETPGGYGPSGSHQYDRLAAAMQLNGEAALKSASWGLGQIMGENFTAAGYSTVDDMVGAMTVSEDNQLGATAQFLKSTKLGARLSDHDWAGFARIYNGPNYAANNYDGLLAQFYARYYNGAFPDLRVRAAQLLLTYRGFKAGAIDGVMGPTTLNAVIAFQASIGVDQNGQIDNSLIAALSVAVTAETQPPA